MILITKSFLVSNDDDAAEILRAFVKEHIQKTSYWKQYDEHDDDEKYFNEMQEWELLEFSKIIAQELSLYFNSISIPALQIASNSTDVVASSIAGK